MVTNYPQLLSLRGAGREATAVTLASRAAARIGQVLCGLRGHETMVHREAKRVMMRCTSCGHDTPGWEISERGPRKRFDGDRQRHLMTTQQMM